MRLILYVIISFMPVCLSYQLFDYLNHKTMTLFKNNVLENKFEYEICNKENSLFNLDSVLITPNPPEKGKKMSIEIKGNLLEEIKKGSIVRVSVKYQLIRIFKKTFDLCEELDKAGDKVKIRCPIEKGEKALKYEVELPGNIPDGKYNIESEIMDKNNNLIFCTKIMLFLDKQ